MARVQHAESRDETRVQVTESRLPRGWRESVLAPRAGAFFFIFTTQRLYAVCSLFTRARKSLRVNRGTYRDDGPPTYVTESLPVSKWVPLRPSKAVEPVVEKHKDYLRHQPPDCEHPDHAQQRVPHRGHHQREIRKQSPCPHSVASGHLNLDLGSHPLESLPLQSPAGLLAKAS